MGENINEIDQTNIILNGIYIIYSILSQLHLPNVRPVTLASNLIRILKLRPFLMKGQISTLCQCHISRTGYHSNLGQLPYQRKLSHNSTGLFPNIKQPRSQQSVSPSNQPVVQHSHPVFKIMTRKFCSIFFCRRKLRNENQIINNKKNQ